MIRPNSSLFLILIYLCNLLRQCFGTRGERLLVVRPIDARNDYGDDGSVNDDCYDDNVSCNNDE